MSDATTTVFVDGRVFTADRVEPWTTALAVRGGKVVAIGDEAAAMATGGPVEVVPLAAALVLPGFIDAHFHTLGAGESLGRVSLELAGDLASIQAAVGTHADVHPVDDWVLGRGWLFDAVPGRAPTAAMLDAVVPDRPVMLDSADFHFSWLNSLALARVGIDAATPNPAGGEIVRGADGQATGLLAETAADTIAWAHLAGLTSDADRLEHLMAIQRAAHAAGMTGVIDMGVDEDAVRTFAAAAANGRLTLQVVGHYLVHRAGSTADHLAAVARAADLAAQYSSGPFRMAGIKIVSDGTIDGCTAHVSRPYTTGELPDPIWDAVTIGPVVTAADAAGLQVAIHAIGDAAVATALDAFDAARTANGSAGRRHRIEHLEYLEPADVRRFADLGVTASMQPVHADPAIAPNWIAMLGEPRGSQGFRWTDMVDAGVRLAFGTDAPTAPFAPLPNMFIAATRRSALDPRLPVGRGADQVRPLDAAVVHATADAAWSCFEEDRRGRLVPGQQADFAVLSPDVFDAEPDALLTALVDRTYVGGRLVHQRDGA
jgi:predicted amidohydrolase YtcJ